jgi:S1-C subfamily serine protease/putative intracellular protease/amidase
MIRSLFVTAVFFVLASGGSPMVFGEEMQDIPAEVVKKVDPSVVAIQHKRGAGSGLIISADGYILSNGHVVRGNDNEDPTQPIKSITVIMSDEHKYPAKVLGFCMNPDVALLKIEPDKPLRPVEFADSHAAQIGQKCFAVGTPIGLKRTFTSGILSNVDRTDLGTFTTVFQTDAAINPGNSGGPLFDRDGRVLGINTYASRGANNLGFTIPTHVILVLKDHLQKYGRFRRADIPMFFATEIYDELAAALGINRGILVSYVMPGTTAEKIGLKMGDIITAINGEPCSARTRAQMMDIEWKFATFAPGTDIDLTILRGEQGRRKEIKVHGKMELDEPMPNTGHFPGEVITHFYDALGFGYKGILRKHRIIYNLTDSDGVLISSVTKNQAASKAGIETGAVIYEVDGVPVDNVKNFEKELEKHLTKHEKAIDLSVVKGKISFKTALAPYYDMKGKKVAIILPRGENSYAELVTRELISDGANITLVTESGEKPSEPAIITTLTSTGLSDVKGGDFDVVLFLDGKNIDSLWHNQDALRIVREAYKAEKILAAIGGASIVLITGEPEILEKKITTAEDISGEAVKLNAHYTGSDVEKDGNIITTTGLERKVVREFLNTLRSMVRSS